MDASIVWVAFGTRGEMSAAGHTVGVNIVRVGLAAAVVLLATQSTADLVASLEFHSYDSLVDLDRSNGIPDIISVAIILSAALGAAVLSTRVRGVRLPAAALSIALMIS